MSKSTGVLALFLAIVLLTACGQKGALLLPEKPTELNTPEHSDDNQV